MKVQIGYNLKILRSRMLMRLCVSVSERKRVCICVILCCVFTYFHAQQRSQSL